MAEEKNAGGEAPASSQSSPAENGGQLKDQTQGSGPAEAPGASPDAPATASGEPQPETHAAPADSPASDATKAAAAVASVSAEPEKSAQPGKTEAPPAATPRSGRRVYQASTVRKTLLSFVFLILLPFFVSLPAMMTQRVLHQLWPDMLGFSIFAAAFAFIMLLVLFELIRSVRGRVAIGESAVRLTLPSSRGIAMPKFFYRTREIPYSEIQAVETRREVYGGIIAPVMLRGARIVTKAGDKIPLGYVSEANVDPVFPVPEIASEIARRAGLEVIDQGTVRRQVHKKLRGIRAADDAASPITDADIAVLNRRHNNVMMALCGALFLLVAGGLMLDISKSNLDLGERAHQLVQNLMKPSSEVQRAGQQ